MMEKLDIPMPESGMATTVDEALEIANKIGYPVMVRPSYVLGGAVWKLSMMMRAWSAIWQLQLV